MLRGQGDGSLHFVGHGGSGENGIGAGGVDERGDAEFLVIIDTLGGRRSGGGFRGLKDGCSAGSDGAGNSGLRAFVKHVTARDFFGAWKPPIELRSHGDEKKRRWGHQE